MVDYRSYFYILFLNYYSMDLKKIKGKPYNIMGRVPLIKEKVEDYHSKKLSELRYISKYLFNKEVNQVDRRVFIKEMYSLIGLTFEKPKRFSKRVKKDYYVNLKGKELLVKLRLDLSIQNLEEEYLEKIPKSQRRKQVKIERYISLMMQRGLNQKTCEKILDSKCQSLQGKLFGWERILKKELIENPTKGIQGKDLEKILLRKKI